MKKNDIKNQMLTTYQVDTVRQMIISSMRDVYTSAGVLPDSRFEEAAGRVAERIVKNVQKALLQSTTYEKLAKKK